jgi:hypothetical protein
VLVADQQIDDVVERRKIELAADREGGVRQVLVGNCLLRRNRGQWRPKLKKLGSIDWRRSNGTMWEGRAMIGGRVSKAAHNVVLTTNAIKRHLGLALTPEEQRIEDAFKRGEYAPQ